MAKTILALGEILWDVFPDGPRFGGAPANFASACAGLGGDRVRVRLATAVGRDLLGDEARRRLADRGVSTELVTAVDAETGQVVVSLDPVGKASYRFIDNPAWDHIPPTPELLAAAATADVICFGTLGQWATPSRDTIRDAVRAARPDAVRVLDINLRPPFWTPELVRDSLPLANVLKLNDEELPQVAGVLGLDSSPDHFLHAVLERYSLRLVALTRGANGAVLLAAGGERSEQPGIPVTVEDTVGAGDAFTAALALGLAHHLSLDRINRWAGEVAAFVCTQPGGTPTFPPRYHL
jgi:fructokinase